LCVIGGQASVDAAKRDLAPGTDLSDMRVASAQAVVDGLAAPITAFRWPGHSAAELLPVLGILSSSITRGPAKFTSGLASATIGDKTVTTWTNPVDQYVSYLYPGGDTLFVIDSVTVSQASKVLSALP